VATTVRDRILKQRDARSTEGWAEVRVWVPSKSDAEKVQAYAAQLRAKALELEDLNELESIKKMHPESLQKFKDALAQQGSRAYTTEFGAVHTLLSDFARDGHIADFAAAFALLARANPAHASSVERDVPAKVMNHYWIRHKGIDAGAFLAWEKEHPEWSETLKACVRNPAQFEQVVDEMGVQMQH